MKLTIVIGASANDLKTIEADDDLDLDSLKALLEVETEIPIAKQLLSFHGQPLIGPQRLLRSFGIQHNDVLLLTKQDSVSSYLQPEAPIWMPSSTFPGTVQELHDSFSIEAQGKIEEAIRQQNILANLEAALEHNPEAFAKVNMLYINVLVNGHPIKAFVDSGAQATILSRKCAESCGLMRLVDTRFEGIAQGVGTAKMIGRIHSTQISMGANLFLLCSFVVMEMNGIDMLFGLDMLKKHQAVMDLGRDVLCIHGQDIPFLPESECPKHAMESLLQPQPQAQYRSQSDPSVVHGSMLGESGQRLRGALAGPSYKANSTASDPAHAKESDIEALLRLSPTGNITRDEIIRALLIAKGNIDLAASILFGLG